MMHWGNFGEFGFGSFHFGWIFMVLFWALVILGGVYLLKQIVGGRSGAEFKESAEDILKKRFATGEIAKEELNDKLTFIKRH